MNGYTHKIGGTCAGITAVALALQEPISTEKLIVSGLIIAGATIGSLIPDIDHKNSTISKKHRVTSWIVTHLFEHRGFTHSPLVQLLLCFFLFHMFKDLSGVIGFSILGLIIGLAIGMLSHSLLDMMTIGGIPLLYPFTKKKFRIMKLKTAKHSGLVAVLCIIITIFIVGGKFVFTFLI